MYIVLGKSGQLASELKATMGKRNVGFFGRNDINLFSKSNIIHVIKPYNPKVIINTSAYTNVDGAESDQINAFKLNEEALKFLASYCGEEGIRLIHISTDFVFDGTKSNPYKVDDNLNPINIYGLSKLGGEIAIRNSCCNDYSIIRTSWLFSSHGKNFVKSMLNLMNSNNELNIVNDQIGRPTHAKGLARFIWSLVDEPYIEKIYHWSDLGKASWFEFANEIYAQGQDLGLLKKNVKINGVPSSEYKTAAIRPRYSVLKVCNKSKTHWKDSLSAMLKEIKKEYNEV